LNNEKYSCESLKTIQRICPGLKPINIYQFKSQRDDESSTSIDFSQDRTHDFSSILSSPWHVEADTFGAHRGITDAFRMAENFLNSFGSGFTIDQQDNFDKFPRHKIPPKFSDPEKDLNKKVESSKPKGRLIGSIEEI